jgi:hypothetical protein
MKWTEPVAVEDHMDRAVRFADGEVRRDANVVLSEEQYRQMAQGYRCCRCYGIVDTAFPETCGFPGCDGYPAGFPMRERQREVMEQEFDGYEWVGISRETYERDMNALDRKLHPATPKSSRIWVPGQKE